MCRVSSGYVIQDNHVVQVMLYRTVMCRVGSGYMIQFSVELVQVLLYSRGC